MWHKIIYNTPEGVLEYNSNGHYGEIDACDIIHAYERGLLVNTSVEIIRTGEKIDINDLACGWSIIFKTNVLPDDFFVKYPVDQSARAEFINAHIFKHWDALTPMTIQSDIAVEYVRMLMLIQSFKLTAGRDWNSTGERVKHPMIMCVDKHDHYIGLVDGKHTYMDEVFIDFTDSNDLQPRQGMQLLPEVIIRLMTANKFDFSEIDYECNRRINFAFSCISESLHMYSYTNYDTPLQYDYYQSLLMAHNSRNVFDHEAENHSAYFDKALYVFNLRNKRLLTTATPKPGYQTVLFDIWSTVDIDYTYFTVIDLEHGDAHDIHWFALIELMQTAIELGWESLDYDSIRPIYEN